MAQNALRPTNQKIYPYGPFWDQNGQQVVDGASNVLNAYVPLRYARVKSGTLSEPAPDQMVFTVQFLNEFNEPFPQADGVCSIEMVLSKRAECSKYMLGTATQDEIDDFEGWLLGAQSVTNLL